jgi:lipoate-protein ligase A
MIAPEESCAIDEAILLARIHDLVPNTLHFYRRSHPTVSLGYFQKAERDIALDYCNSNKIKIMRRVSGGSAIYTDDRQLIYSVILKEDLGSVPESYEKICEAIILGLNIIGVEAKFKPANDILVGGKKISGSAQLRRQDTILQQGTILADADLDVMFKTLKVPEEKFKPLGLKHPIQKMTTLKIEGFDQKMDILKDSIRQGFERFFEVDIKKSGLIDYEKKLVDNLIRDKYGSDEWNLRT